MNYFFTTQGTIESDYGLVFKNGIKLDNENIERKRVYELISKIEEQGDLISTNAQELKVLHLGDDYVIQVLTINKDDVGRFVPVDMIIENYSSEKVDNTSLEECYVLLESNGVEINKTQITQLVNKLDVLLKEYRLKENLKKGFVAAVVAFLALFILKNLMR